MTYHLAQFNLGKLRHPRGSPKMVSHYETLKNVVPVALTWLGFIWIMDHSIIDSIGRAPAAELGFKAENETAKQKAAFDPQKKP